MTGWALICFVVLVALATMRSLPGPGRARPRRPLSRVATKAPPLGRPVETVQFSPAARGRAGVARRGERG